MNEDNKYLTILFVKKDLRTIHFKTHFHANKNLELTYFNYIYL